MTSHIQLFNLPRGLAAPPPALAVVGEFPKYESDIPYEGRLDILNAIGKCTVELTAGTLPPGTRLYVDNFTEQVVVSWDSYTPYVLGDPGPVPNGNFEAGDDGSWSMDRGWSIDENNDPRTGSWNGRLIKTGDNLMLRGARVPSPPVPNFHVEAQGYIQQGASAAGRAKAQMEIAWYDDDGIEVGRVASRLVDDGDGGDWSDAQTLVTVEGDTPVGASSVAIEFRGWRTQSKQSLGVDDVTWNVPYGTGITTQDPIAITLKVTDAAGRIAFWTGVIEWGLPIPTVVGVTKYEPAGTVSSWPLPLPAGIEAGDQLFIFLTQRSASTAANIPAGWTHRTDLSGNRVNSQRNDVFQKTALGTESGTITLTRSTTVTSSAAMCICVRGASSTVPAVVAVQTDPSIPNPAEVTVANGETTLFVVGYMARVITHGPSVWSLAENQEWASGPTSNRQQGIVLCAQSGHTSNTFDPPAFNTGTDGSIYHITFTLAFTPA